MEIKITPDGLFGQAVNPFSIIYLHPDLDYQEEMNKKYSDFEANNPPFPLTKEGEPGKVVDAVLKYQGKQTDTDWKNITAVEYENEVIFNNQDEYSELRKAFEVISNDNVSTLNELKKEIELRLILNGGKSNKDVCPTCKKPKTVEPCFCSDSFHIVNKEEMPQYTQDQLKQLAKKFEHLPQDVLDSIIEDKEEMPEKKSVSEQTLNDAALDFNKAHPEMDSWSAFIAGVEWKEQNSEVAEQSIEEAFKEWVKHQSTMNSELEVFIAGAEYNLNKKGLVSKDRVCEVIEKRINGLSADVYEIELLIGLLNQIKEL